MKAHQSWGLWDEFAVSISKQTLSRELREAGYRKLSARPRHHAQDDDAIPLSKSLSHPVGSGPGDASTRYVWIGAESETHL